MKRTVYLILLLLFIASALLVYALYAKPSEKKQPVSQTATKTPATPTPTADTQLSLSTDAISLTDPDTVTLMVRINTGKNQVTGVQLEVGFDPDALENVKIQPGNFLPRANILLDTNDQKTGRYSYALVLNPSQSPVSGEGILAKITARRRAEFTPGSSTQVSLLPKSLVSALGSEASVLKKTDSTTVKFPARTTPNDTLSVTQPAGTGNIDQSTP